MSRRTILIVDDHIPNLKIAVEHLRAYSFEILTASNGEVGLERAQLTRPDLILLDIKLPGIDGIETCRRLKANPDLAPIPVVFMTALDEASEKVRGLEAGAVDYVTKPVEAIELLARVRTHLTLRDLQLQLEAQVRDRAQALENEIEQRLRHQQEKEQLLVLVGQQSDQLRALTAQILEQQTQREQGLAQTLSDEVTGKLRAVEQYLQLAQQQLGEGAPHAVREPLAQAQAIVSEIQHHTQRVADDLRQPPLIDRNNPLLKLTAREYEVLQLVAQGKSNAEIADLLVISKSTVGTYRMRVMNKLELEDLPALIKFAVTHHLPT